MTVSPLVPAVAAYTARVLPDLLDLGPATSALATDDVYAGLPLFAAWVDSGVCEPDAPDAPDAQPDAPRPTP